MAANQWLALEWDSREARALVMKGGPRGPGLKTALAFPLSEAEQQADVQSRGNFLRDALASAGITVKAAWVAAGPGDVVSRHLKLPPARDDELPAMVRFQMAGELTATIDDAAVDFTPLSSAAGGERRVLAAALPAVSLQRHRQVWEAAGLSTGQLVLRGQASAAALREHVRRSSGGAGGGKSSENALLVDFTADSFCLTVLVGGECVMARARRLPNQAEAAASAGGEPPALIAGEIVRTLAALRGQLPAHSVEKVYLAGDAQGDLALAEAVSAALERPVLVFDPLALLGAGKPASADEKGRTLEGTSHPGGLLLPSRAAPLVGMALAHIHRAGPEIDFLHPKQPAVKRGQGRRLVVPAALAAGVLLGGGALWYALSVGTLQRQLAVEREESARLDKQLAKYRGVERAAELIGAWQDPEVVWLDELYELSSLFPPARDAYATQLDLLPASAQVRSRIRLQALARDREAISRFERELSADAKHYRVDPRGVHSSAGSAGPYPRQFVSEIAVTGLSPQQYAERAAQRRETTAKEAPDRDSARAPAPPPSSGAPSPSTKAP